MFLFKRKKEKKLWDLVKRINDLEKQVACLTMEQRKARIQELKKTITDRQEYTEEELEEVFALVRETARLTLGQRPYDVQVMGGIALSQGKVIEMKTGEGKTLAATMPLVLEALKSRGAHLVTVNDYLAQRDTVWMGQIYHALGLSVACLTRESAFLYDPDYIKDRERREKLDKERDKIGGFKVVKDFLRPITKKQAYQADITYGTNNDFGFDYLRDNLVYDIKDKVQRPLHYAIIDEVDSILIDEARTPLIISAPRRESLDTLYRLANLVKKLSPQEDVDIDEKLKTVVLTEKGQGKVVLWLGKDPWAENNIPLLYRLEAALRAQFLFKKDRDYIVKNGQVLIVDEFTGRILPGRRWSAGIHEAIEAKEGVSIRQEMKTLATITFQNYFRLYEKLAGMTGTAMTEAEEFYKIYNLETIAIPTHRPMIRKDLPDKIYQTEQAKFKALIQEVKARHEKGQPILIGTRSIEKSELIARLLKEQGLSCQVLNAKYHEKEGEIIAQAGKLGAITVATNMAGRGVDIILGGNPPDEEQRKKIIQLGGLCVLGTEKHESRRIDNQLRGRSGRQGDPGVSQFFISLEDDIARDEKGRIFNGQRIKNLMKSLNLPPDYAIENRTISRLLERAQEMVEGFYFDIRKRLLEYDDVLNAQRKKIYQQRDEVLGMNKEQLEEFILQVIKKEIRQIIHSLLQNTKDYQEINFKLIADEMSNLFPVPLDFEEKLKQVALSINKNKELEEKLVEYNFGLAKKFLEEKQRALFSKEPPVLSEDEFVKIQKRLILQIIDYFFQNYLEEMEYFKQGISLRAYGQKDPLDEFRRESLIKFRQLNSAIWHQVAQSILNLNIPRSNKSSLRKV